MRRSLAILLLGPLLGCGAHLHHPFDDQLAAGAVDKVEELDWDAAFAHDREQRDATADREAELGLDHADARREAELLDVLTEPIGERSWAKLEDRFVALAACMLDEPGTRGGRACRAGLADEQREAARALLFDACPAEGCAWVRAIVELRAASRTLTEQLAGYDRARADARLSDAEATAAQCPVPTRLPAALREPGKRLAQACADYDRALAAVAEALPEGSGIGRAIADYRSLAATRDGYRDELRLLVAELSSVHAEGRFDRSTLAEQVAHYVALQSKYAPALAGARLGDFGDLALEGTLLVTREHRAAVIRTLARLVPRAVPKSESGGESVDEDAAASEGESFRAESSPAPTEDPPRPEAEPEDTVPREPDPIPPRPIPDPTPIPDPPITETPSSPSERARVDVELVRQLGASLAPVFGETWRTLHEQEREAQRGELLLSAEIERIQITAMTRRLGYAEDRVWLELAAIETQLLALLRLRQGLAADWIPDARPSTDAHAELERLRLELELAEAKLELAQDELAEAVEKAAGKPDKPKGKPAAPEGVAAAKGRVHEARARVDAAADAVARQLEAHGAALCLRRGTVSQTYERDSACVDPIERLVGLHAELVGVALPRLESLDRSAARRRDEATLLRDQAGLEIRITYVAACVAALHQFTSGGLEGRDVAAIVGAVVGIGLGAAITAGVYIP